MMTAPSRMPRISRSISGYAKISTLARNARKIARPPMRGMGWWCIRRLSVGTSIAPTFCASRFTSGVTAKESTAALRSASPTRRIKFGSKIIP